MTSLDMLGICCKSGLLWVRLPGAIATHQWWPNNKCKIHRGDLGCGVGWICGILSLCSFLGLFISWDSWRKEWIGGSLGEVEWRINSALLCERGSKLGLFLVGFVESAVGSDVSRGRRKRRRKRVYSIYGWEERVVEGEGWDDVDGIGSVGSDRCGLSPPLTIYPAGGSMGAILTSSLVWN